MFVVVPATWFCRDLNIWTTILTLSGHAPNPVYRASASGTRSTSSTLIEGRASSFVRLTSGIVERSVSDSRSLCHQPHPRRIDCSGYQLL